MKKKKQMLDAANSLEPDPPRSKLDDYAQIIWTLRRKRKRICTITAFLNQHGIQVGKSTVARWLKTHPVPKADTPTERHPSQSAVVSTADRARAHRFFNTTEEP
ncbi:MAG: hypothetical protein WDN28_23490 [Chthoniobacter sp.]